MNGLSAKQYYDDASIDYDVGQDQLFFKIYDSITWKYTEPYIPKSKNALVLDAAGGTGKWSIPIARKGPKVVLLDLSNGMIEVARKKIVSAALGERVETRVGNVSDLDFDDETFDMVFCDHALGFFDDASVAVAELARVLKRNATIIISAQNQYPLALSLFNNHIDTGINILERKQPFLMRGKVPVYTMSPDQFRSTLEESSIKLSKIIGKGLVLTPLVLPMQTLYMEKYDEEYYQKILKVELELCERPDALALAGHLQAIGTKA